MSSNAPDQPDHPGNHSASADSDATLAESSLREQEINRQSEELVHRLAQIVQGVVAEVPSLPPFEWNNPPSAENSLWAENPHWAEELAQIENTMAENASPPLPTWHDWPTATSPTHPSLFSQGRTPSQPSISRHEPIGHAEILRRAQRAVQAEIYRRLREPFRGPVHRARRTASMLVSRMSQSGVKHRRITISERELRFFAMRREVERLQEEIDLVRAGGDNTNDWEEKN